MATRDRSYNDIVKTPRAVKCVSHAGNPYDIKSDVYNGATGTMTDIVSPRFKQLSGSGLVLNNPMTSTKTDQVQIAGGYSYTRTGRGGDYWEGFYTNGVPFKEKLSRSKSRNGPYFDMSHPFDSIDLSYGVFSDSESGQSIAINKAYAGIDQSSADALVTMAEFGKTVATIKSLMYKAIKVRREQKKIIKRLATQGLSKSDRKALEDLYMELRYGLRPIIIDINNVAKASNTRRDSPGTRKVSRGTHTDAAEDSFSDTSVVESGKYKTTIEVTSEGEAETVYRAGVLYELTEISFPELKTWGFHDLLGTGFELTPYSFIGNWFFNLSDTVQAFQPKAGVKILASWVTIVSKTTEMTNKNYNQTWDSEGKTLWDYADGGFERSSGPYGRIIKYSCAEVKTVTSKSRLIGVKPKMPTVDIRLDPFKMADLAIIFKKFGSR